MSQSLALPVADRHSPELTCRLYELASNDVAARCPEAEVHRIDLALALEDGSGWIAFARDEFDSELFDLQIGRILAAQAATRNGYAMLATVLAARVRELGYDQIVRRTRVENLAEIWTLENAGFELMDVGVIFGQRLTPRDPAPQYADLRVRFATKSDIAELAREMVQLPWGGRFDADPAYDPARVRELRSRWLFNSEEGRAGAFLIGETAGRPAGYVTCLLDARADHGEIELVGTLPSFRCRRVASRILQHALSWFSTRTSFVTVRTQATNLAATRLYEQAGFTFHSSDLTLRLALTARGGSMQ